ncbi:uncharacterized protein METZ01_LOCUS311667, partial [marine metagenome]
MALTFQARVFYPDRPRKQQVGHSGRQAYKPLFS